MVKLVLMQFKAASYSGSTETGSEVRSGLELRGHEFRQSIMTFPAQWRRRKVLTSLSQFETPDHISHYPFPNSLLFPSSSLHENRGDPSCLRKSSENRFVQKFKYGHATARRAVSNPMGRGRDCCWSEEVGRAICKRKQPQSAEMEISTTLLPPPTDAIKGEMAAAITHIRGLPYVMSASQEGT